MQIQIDAPNLGQHLTFAAPDATVLRASCVLQPGASVPLHVHLHQHERFSVIEGSLDVTVGGVRCAFGPAESATIAPGVAHRFRNRSGGPVRVDIEIWPPLRTRELFTRLFALDRDGALGPGGAPGPFELGRLAREFGDELFLLARVPVGLQLAIGRALGAVAPRRRELQP